MSTITIRNLSKESHRALKLRAARHGRSMEAEIRYILENSVLRQVCIGSALAAIGRSVKGVELDLRRDANPVLPANLDT